MQTHLVDGELHVPRVGRSHGLQSDAVVAAHRNLADLQIFPRI